MRRIAEGKQIRFLDRWPVRYGVAVVAVGLAMLLRHAFEGVLGDKVLFITFYPAVMLAAVLGGFRSGILATCLTALVVYYWFLWPVGRLGMSGPADVLALSLFCCMGVFMSAVAGLYHRALGKTSAYEKSLAVRESQERYRELVQNANSAIVRWGRDGRIAFFNEYAQKFFGYGSEEIIGRDVSILVPQTESTGADLSSLIQDILNYPERYVNNVNENILKDGRRVWMSWTNKPILDENGQVAEILAVGSDVTEQKLAQDALLESNKRLELLSDTASRLLVTQDPQGLVQSLCERVMQVLGCHTFFNFLVDESRNCLHLNACAGIPDEVKKSIEWLDYGVAVCGCVARDGCRVVAEDIFNTPDPRTDLVKGFGIQAYACHPLLAGGGKVIGTLSFGSKSRTCFTDDELSLMRTVADQVATAMERIRLLDEARLRAQAVAESEATFRAVLDAVQESLWMFDPDGVVLACNTAAAAKLGRTPAETVGKKIDDLVSPELAHTRWEQITSAFTTGRSVDWEDERDGFIFNHTTYPVTSDQGEVSRVVIFSHDITETRLAEKHEREMEAHRLEFYRRTILAATEGKLMICEREEIEAVECIEMGSWEINDLSDLGAMRDDVLRLSRQAGMCDRRVMDFLGCIVEAGSNAIKHAGSGRSRLCRRDSDLICIVSDSGHGIGALALPDVALAKGFSTAGTLGMGYKVMLRFADQVNLATGPDGTAVAIHMSLLGDAPPIDEAVGHLTGWAE